MRVHSIDCGTLCPLSARLVNGAGGLFSPARLVCHCWLIESKDGLVLVDTGLGLADVADSARNLGLWFRLAVRPALSRETTAVAQIERLGFRASDVRHIVPTHLDLDHAGGLRDFPDAEVHVYRAEFEAAMARETLHERARYLPYQWAHGPRWKLHEVQGDRWLGFDSVRALGKGDDEILLIPLPGHTRGHCGVAVRDGEGWRLHAGDAYFFHGRVDGAASTPLGLAAFERLAAIDSGTMRANQLRLAELARTRGSEMRINSAHCPVEFDLCVERERVA